MQEQSELGRRIASGAFWLILMRFSTRGIGVASTLILARLLIPADFGIVAIATMVAGIIEALGAWGFEYSLFVRAVTVTHYHTVWTLNVLRGFVTALVMALLAPALAIFFNEDRLTPVLLVLSIGSIIDGLSNVGIVEFRKELKMRKEYAYHLSAKLGGFVVTFVLAVLLQNYWALVSGILAGKLIGLLASYLMVSFRPRFCLQEWRLLVNVSKWVLATSIVQVATRNLDIMVLGRVANMSAVGIYSIAWEVSNLATSELIYPIRSALFPGYAKCAGNPALLRQMYLGAFGICILIGAPVALGIGSVAAPLVNVFFGPQWSDAVPLIQLLVLAGFFQAANATSSTVVWSLGRAKLSATVQVIGAIVQLALLLAGSKFGPKGIAIAMIGASAFTTSVYTIVALRVTGVTAQELLSASWRSLTGTAGMMLISEILLQIMPVSNDIWTSIAALFLIGSVGAVSYVLLVFVLWLSSGSPRRTAESLVLDAVTARFRQKLSSASE